MLVFELLAFAKVDFSQIVIGRKQKAAGLKAHTRLCFYPRQKVKQKKKKKEFPSKICNPLIVIFKHKFIMSSSIANGSFKKRRYTTYTWKTLIDDDDMMMMLNDDDDRLEGVLNKYPTRFLMIHRAIPTAIRRKKD